MAKITEEQKTAINEIYFKNHNKTQTAKEVGVSVYTVNKYLIPNYIPLAARVAHSFDKRPTGCAAMIEKLQGGDALGNILRLSDEEWVELHELQKNEVFETEF